LRAIAAMSPYVADAVVTGHDRDHVGLLLFLSPQGRQADLAQVTARVLLGLREMAGEGGSSHAPKCALLLDDAPSLDAGEITDKGYINQRAVLDRRTAEVAALHSTPLDPRVVAL
jgi:feruloyl-CoA synthase